MFPDFVTGTFKFIEWQDLYHHEKPFQVLTQIPPDADDQRDHNLKFKDGEVLIRDIRSMKIEPTLDTHGFQVHKRPLSLHSFSSRRVVEDQYLPEVERLIREEVDDVGSVFIFDWRLRNTLPTAPAGTVLDLNDRTSFLRPTIHFHVDQSPAGVLDRIMLHLKDQAPLLLTSRVRVINIWRPIVGPVGDWALALCDGSSARAQDLIETDHIRRHYTGSSMYLQRNPDQCFYYLSRQTEEDVFSIKIFDSKRKDLQAPYCPHASFRLPYHTPDGVPRQSIEVRCLIFSHKMEIPKGYHEQVRKEFGIMDEFE